MNFQVYGSNTQTFFFDTVSTAVTGPTHSFRSRDGPDVRTAMALHAPFYVGRTTAPYAPAASRGSATAENFKVVTYNVGAKADIMFSSAQRKQDFRDKTDRDMLLFYQDAVAYARHGVDDRGISTSVCLARAPKRSFVMRGSDSQGPCAVSVRRTVSGDSCCLAAGGE